MSFISENMEALLAGADPRKRQEDFVKHFVLPNLDRWNNIGLYYHLKRQTTRCVEEFLGYDIFPNPAEWKNLREFDSKEQWPFVQDVVYELKPKIKEIAQIPDGLTLEENAVEILKRAYKGIDEIVAEWLMSYFDAKRAEMN